MVEAAIIDEVPFKISIQAVKKGNIMGNELYEVTVKQGEDIKTVITDFILQHHWTNVYITGAVGSVIDMVFTTPARNYLPLQCTQTPVEEAAEMISMSGEVMPIAHMDPELKNIYPDKDSPLFVHIHAACAIKGGQVIGGGMQSGKAFRSLRVFMIPLQNSNDEEIISSNKKNFFV